EAPARVWIIEAGERAVPVRIGSVQGAVVERRNAARGPGLQIERLVIDMHRRPGFSCLEVVGAADGVANVRLIQICRLSTLKVTVVERQQEFLVERHAGEIRYGRVKI